MERGAKHLKEVPDELKADGGMVNVETMGGDGGEEEACGVERCDRASVSISKIGESSASKAAGGYHGAVGQYKVDVVMRQEEDHMKRQELLREETNGGCGAAGRDDEVRERCTSRAEASSRGDVHARSSRASVWHRAERRVWH
jgi:hypothetical protein